MADAGQDKTALGIARARFMDGLPRKAKELKGAVALLVGTPDAERPREEMRRRLHALYASAQVFQEETLAAALRDGIQRLDSAREQQRSLTEDDLDTLVDLAAQLPSLGSGRQGVPSVSLPPRRAAAARAPAPPVPPPPPQRAVEQHPAERPGGSESARASHVPRPPSIRPTPATQSDAISVLVVDDAEAEAQVRRALPVEQFEVIGTRDPEEALRVARAAAPDVVLVGHHLVAGSSSDLIGRLRADPLTDFVPVILLWPSDATHDPALQSAVGADESLRKPVDAPSLLRRIAALTAAPGRFGGGIDTLHEATVEEVADRVAREIRQGIVDSVQSGREQSISLGDGTDILAAAWSAIGRIRSHLAQRSGGRVQFRDAPRRGGPAMLALVGQDGDDSGLGEISVEQIKGRRVIVADDDPAVLWFFSGLLREAGATVVEAADGRAALEQTRRQRPDVVISDILMPEVDGFALCRELKRDVSVADIPVILLSWKEDFLQRMRELQSGASGYLLKESGGRQILTRVLDVLRPRVRLEEQLRAGGEVRGRIDGIGIMSLLETVAAQRPDARVTIRDAWNLFEIDLRKGNLVTISRTSTDGSFARGDLALRQMLGAKSGRFSVADSDAPVRPIFELPLARLLTETARKLSALLDAVSDARLMQVHSVTFDDPTLAAMVTTSPSPTRDILERLRSGASPRQLIVDGQCAPHELESVLDDAARRGALTQVLGANQEDLVGLALAEREQDLGVLMHSNRPPADRRSLAPVIASTLDDTPELPSSDLKSEPPGPMFRGGASELSEALASARSEARAVDADRELDLAFERGSIPPPLVVNSFPPPVPEDARHRTASEGAELPVPPGVELETAASASALPAEEDVALGDPTPVDEAAPAMSIPPAAGSAEIQLADSPAAAPSVESAIGDTLGEAKTVLALEAPAPPVVAAEAPAPTPEPVVPVEPVVPAKPAAPAPPVVAPTAAAAPESSLWTRVLFVAAVMAVGFGGFSLLQQSWRPAAPVNSVTEEGDDDEVDEPAAEPTASAPAPTPAPVAEPPAPVAPASATQAAAPPAGEREVGFGRVLPYIDETRGQKVAAGEGLLVVEANPEVPNARIRIGERDLGVAPISAALAPGRHEVIFQRGDESSFRYLVIRGGETRIVQVP